MKDNQGWKGAREATGSQPSQTDEDRHSCGCHNMAATIEAINQKLDLALSRPNIIRKNDGETEEAREEMKDNQGWKGAREATGSQPSQTDEDRHSCGCHNMAATIEAINQKLDLALSRFQEIDDLKEKL
ncbi:hypothetical protein ACROYT_G014671 [Oculina patagonica]